VKALCRCFFLAGLSLMLVVSVCGAATNTFTSAYISEFLANNERGLKDDTGERSPWIEIYNGGQSRINLSGWFLTDNPTNLTKWRLPNFVLLPDKFTVVFASGKDLSKDLTHLHANFKLSPNGGYLALVNPSTNIVSEFKNYPKSKADVSYGCVRREPNITGPFVHATPGKHNASSGEGFATEVAFSKPNTSFTEDFSLNLSASSKKAIIRITQDGTLPTSTSPIYTNALLITNTVCVRARAYQEGLLPGPPQSGSYIRVAAGALSFTSTLPVLVMETFGKRLMTSSEDRFVHLSLHEPINGRTSFTNPPTFTSRGGFHIRGSTSSGFPQSPYALEFVDEFNDERSLPILGMPADSDWVLYAPNQYDPIMIHNPFVHQLSRDMGRYSPRTRFVEVFMVRGAGRLRETDYHGLYVLTEKIKSSKDRVNMERVGADDLKAPKVTGGYMLKYDRVGPGESGVFGRGDRGLVYVEPKEEVIKTPQRAPQREYINGFVKEFLRTLYAPDWKDSKKGYRSLIDADAAIDFHVLELLSGNVDAMVLSSYFHKPRNGKIICGPHWDFDRALGSIDPRDVEPRRWITGPFFSGEWWPRLFSDPDFWQQWVDRWQELRGTHFSMTNMNRLIDQLCNEVKDAQPREYAKWGLEPRGGTYATEIIHMKDWLSNRVDFIDEQLTAPPRFSKQGNVLTLSTQRTAKVYYTLDGSDPRLPQGAISTNATVYTKPIELKAGVRVKARAHDPGQTQTGGPPLSTPWSRPVSAP
jgi:hypothetical protein